MLMNSSVDIHEMSPIVIGGVGGSGTRVVAQIIMELSIYMGNNHNEANDNLFFTYLFKRPEWYANASDEEVLSFLELHEKLLLSKKITEDEVKLIFDIFLNTGTNLNMERSVILNSINYTRSNPEVNTDNYLAWGWKEPNSFIYLDQLNLLYPQMKFIYVVRHGLDMAYSIHHQNKFWATKFGLTEADGWGNLPIHLKKLEYWVKANEFAFTKGKDLMKDRFYILNFDELCLQPQKELTGLMEFLNLKPNQDKINKLLDLIKVPASLGRYRLEDMSSFTERHFQEVERFGFKVEL